ncbi:MAG: hypothetical protein A2W09_05090 [Deltaproteobacteria bacterium RBG_16_50_11]|nr:MAG: hypothetical protein A2W09_05090 [Deltaproteobacteria bacterium RBG_16_50_11]
MKKGLWIILLLTAGCVQGPWVQVAGLYNMDSQNFSVELPPGWMRLNQENYLLITRDGAPLQNIRVLRLNVETPFKYTKKKFSASMLPHEAGEVILDNIASDQNISDFSLLENTPLKISGVSGFRAVYTFKNKDGLKIKSIYCGFIADKWFYGLNYNAAQRYYFDKDVGTFEKVVGSFRLIKTT